MAFRKRAKLSKKQQKANAKKAEFETPVIRVQAPVAKEKGRIEVGPVIGVNDLAKKMNASVTDVIKSLIKNGVMATINENIDFETASIVADEFNFEVGEQSEEKTTNQPTEEVKKTTPGKARPPVVTIMGHVDHGKTSILDYIRKAHVVDKESGGITQHIGAYQATKKNQIITFIDTPGHEAFSKMRAHGANITDIVVLVVAADDGVKPQTIEAADHAKVANVPLIVAINKIDAPGADQEKVKRELADINLLPEEWGGETVMVPVSAKTGQGIEELLDMILLVSEMKQLKAHPEEPATCVVIESVMEKGKGASATILVQDGTLHINDAVVVGTVYGRIRTMEDYAGKKTKEALPSTPIKISGLSKVADVGEQLIVVGDTKIAKELAEKNLAKDSAHGLHDVTKSMMHDLTEKVRSGEINELKLIIKCDVKGSVDALLKVITDIKTEKVSVNIIRTGVGKISESDIMMAKASDALIFGFRAGIDSQSQKIADTNKVLVKSYDIIYELVDDLKSILKGLIAPEVVEIEIGKAKVVQIFRDDKKIRVAGCNVIEGKIARDANIKIKREKEIIQTAVITSLRRTAEEVKEIISGSDCGIGFAGGTDVQVGDVLVAFRTETRESSL